MSDRTTLRAVLVGAVVAYFSAGLVRAGVNFLLAPLLLDLQSEQNSLLYLVDTAGHLVSLALTSALLWLAGTQTFLSQRLSGSVLVFAAAIAAARCITLGHYWIASEAVIRPPTSSMGHFALMSALVNVLVPGLLLWLLFRWLSAFAASSARV